MDATNSARLAVGRVLKPQGLRGEIKVEALTDEPSQLADLERVYIRDVPRAVRGARVQDGGVYLYIEGVENREAAEALRGAVLHADRADLPPLPEGRHYIVDLIGCRACTDDGQDLGSVHDVLQAGGNDVYDIRGGGGGNLLVPAVKVVIDSIDIAARRIVLRKDKLPEVAVYEDRGADPVS